jgi:succinate dehydrogenase / fumarate reductase cytochrome b subunit
MHGISSMFQSLGLRNAPWRRRLDRLALVVALLVFIGFAAIPLASLAGLIEPITPLAAAH